MAEHRTKLVKLAMVLQGKLNWIVIGYIHAILIVILLCFQVDILL